MKRRNGAEQTPNELLRKIGKVLRVPGLTRAAAFSREPKANGFAYPVDPSDPRRMVRESPDGTKTIGRMVHGRFRVIRSK